MKNIKKFFAESVAGSVLLGLLTAFPAGSVSELRPSLEARPASDIRLESSGGSTLLRFSTTSWNKGLGPLELRAGEVVASRQNVYQRIYNDDGTFFDSLAGDFVWHEAHSHFHFENYALYTLEPVSAPGASARTSSKTTFCVMDTTRVNTKLPNAPKRAVYDTCGSLIQGMSVGWGDTYKYYLAGQAIDITGLPDGDYNLIIEIDPQNKIAEIDESDNVATIGIRLSGGAVEVIGGGGPGRCPRCN